MKTLKGETKILYCGMKTLKGWDEIFRGWDENFKGGGMKSLVPTDKTNILKIFFVKNKNYNLKI